MACKSFTAATAREQGSLKAPQKNDLHSEALHADVAPRLIGHLIYASALCVVGADYENTRYTGRPNPNRNH